MFPKWPERARVALLRLFQPLQEVDVFVEDENDEVFYVHLLRRATGGTPKVVRVFGLQGRQSVVDAAARHAANGRPTVFIIDGDFDWVLARAAPALPRLHRLEAYCVENLLIGEGGALQIVLEESGLSADEAKVAIAFNEWTQEMEGSLVELFAAYAVAYEFAPGHRTVSRGIGALITTGRRGSLPLLDKRKVAACRDQALAAAAAVRGEEVARRRYGEILSRAGGLARPLDIVSGKDVLLPLLDFRLRSLRCQLDRATLRRRLAMHCEPANTGRLASAVQGATV